MSPASHPTITRAADLHRWWSALSAPTRRRVRRDQQSTGADLLAVPGRAGSIARLSRLYREEREAWAACRAAEAAASAANYEDEALNAAMGSAAARAIRDERERAEAAIEARVAALGFAARWSDGSYRGEDPAISYCRVTSLVAWRSARHIA